MEPKTFNNKNLLYIIIILFLHKKVKKIEINDNKNKILIFFKTLFFFKKTNHFHAWLKKFHISLCQRCKYLE